MKTAIVIIGVISCVTVNTAFADDSDFIDEVKAFKDDYPQAGLSYDSTKQIVTSIHNVDLGKEITNNVEAAEAAESFLEKYPALFRLREVEYSLTDTTSSGINYFVYFKQFYHTIPVWNAYIMMLIKSGGFLKSLDYNFRPDVSVDTDPVYNEDHIKSILLDHYSLPEESVTYFSFHLIVYYKSETESWHLAWYSLIECPTMAFSVQVFTDAHTGTILNDYGVPDDTLPDDLNVLDSDEDVTPSVSVFPNPFNPVTTISYKLPQTSQVSLAVYSISGQKISVLVDGVLSAGVYSVTWDASDFPSGVYIYRLKGFDFAETGKMMLVK